MIRRRPTIPWLALLVLGACKPAAAPQPTTRTPYEAVAAALLQGSARPRATCQADSDCAATGATGGVCMLAGCYGLLNAPNRAARRTLVVRLEAAGDPVRDAARPPLLAAITDQDATTAARQGAIEGLGALLRGHPQPAAAAAMTAALRQCAAQDDPQLAAAARIELASQGDAELLPALAEDVQVGTELLRLEALRGLAGLHATAASGAARDAVIARLSDPSPAVQAAAVSVLGKWRSDPAARTALAALTRQDGPQSRAAHLTYTIDRILGEAP